MQHRRVVVERLFQFNNLFNLDGILILEISGNEQRDKIESLFISYNLKTNFYKDLQQEWRVVEVER